MNQTEVMKRLKTLGSEQTRRTFARHGITAEMYGVRYGDLSKLVKKIGTDQELAEQLWETSNHDARVLATMIADPARIKASLVDRWVKAVDNGLMLDAIAKLAAKTATAPTRMKKWMKARQEWIAATGWQLLAALLCDNYEELGDDELAGYVDHIEAHIHHSPNEVRSSMNGALIALGLRNAPLHRKAIAAAKRIGKVDVDHGQTACKTPDAAAYIKKALARRSREKTVLKKKRQTVSS